MFEYKDKQQLLTVQTESDTMHKVLHKAYVWNAKYFAIYLITVLQ